MAKKSTSVTGDAVNENNFEKLVFTAAEAGGSYSPSNPALGLVTIQLQLTDIKSKRKAYHVAATPWIKAYMKLEEEITPIGKLTTRIVNAAAASAVSQEFKNKIKSYGDFIRGVRKSPKIVIIPGEEVIPTDKIVKQISASHVDIGSRLDNFDKMLQLLISEPGYAPAEAELSTASLTAFLGNLETLNTAVNSSQPHMMTAMQAKNEALYRTSGGAVETAGKIKKYFKSLYGASSPEFKKIAKLKFTNREI